MTSRPLLERRLASSDNGRSKASSALIATESPSQETAKPSRTSEKPTVKFKRTLLRIKPALRNTSTTIANGVKTSFEKAADAWHITAALWKKAPAWTPETFNCIVALASLTGLVVTLLVQGNKTLPDWPKLVSVNSIVSIFSLSIRTAVCFVVAEGISQTKWQWFDRPQQLSDMDRFDSASRSAWGSFLILCKPSLRGSYWITALGALITIMATLTGFFTQQLIVFEDCQRIDSSASAGVWRTNHYGSEQDNNLFIPMGTAIGIGITQPIGDRTGALTENCTTGNCTLPSDNGASFSTVAISHHCQNRTADLRIDRTVWEGAVSLQSEGLSLSRAQEDSTYNMVMFSNLTYSDDDSYIVRISFLHRKEVEDDLRKIAAVSCDLYAVINTYGVNISNSVMKETLVESVRLRHCPGTLGSFCSATSYTLRNGKRQRCEWSNEPGPDHVSIRVPENDSSSRNGTDITVYRYYPPDCVWSWTAGLGGLDTYIEQIFAGTSVSFVTMDYGRLEASVQLRKVYETLQSDINSMDPINSLFTNMTTAINTVVRTNGPDGRSGMARADVWYTTTCMRISWVWITFPAVMIVLCIVFLCLVAFMTRGVERERMWKSSILAVLFCEVDDTAVVLKPVGKHKMDLIASTTSVSLGQDLSTLRLIGASRGTA